MGGYKTFFYSNQEQPETSKCSNVLTFIFLLSFMPNVSTAIAPPLETYSVQPTELFWPEGEVKYGHSL